MFSLCLHGIFQGTRSFHKVQRYSVWLTGCSNAAYPHWTQIQIAAQWNYIENQWIRGWTWDTEIELLMQHLLSLCLWKSSKYSTLLTNLYYDSQSALMAWYCQIGKYFPDICAKLGLPGKLKSVKCIYCFYSERRVSSYCLQWTTPASSHTSTHMLHISNKATI